MASVESIDLGSVDTRSGRFAFEAHGPTGGEIVLAAHGFPDHPPTYRRLGRALAARGYRVIAPWMRGYAPSTLDGPFDLERIATDLIEIAAALSPDRPVNLVGHDWGACAAYVALVRQPTRFRRAVTMSVPHPAAFASGALRHPIQLRRSAYMAWFNLPGVAPWSTAWRDFALIDRLWHTWSPGYRPDAGFMRDLKTCLARSMPAPILYYRALVPWMVRNGRRGLSRVRVPTLYLHGADDGCVGTEIAAGQHAYFRARFESVVVPSAGHFLHLEAPESVERAIVAWLDRRDDAVEARRDAP